MEESKHSGFYKGAHKTFADWEPTPPADAWNKIELRLEEDKRRPVLWWWLSGIALLLTLAGGWYFLFDTSANNPVNNMSSNAVITAKNQNGKVQAKQDVEAKQANSANSTVSVNPVKSSSNNSKPGVEIKRNTTVNPVITTINTTAPPVASKPKIVFANSINKDAIQNSNITEPAQKNRVSQNSQTEVNAVNSASSSTVNPVPGKNNNSQQNNQVSLNSNGAAAGNIETDSSFTTTKKPKPSSAEVNNVKSDSVIVTKQSENIKPQIIKTDSATVKKDSAAPVKALVTDSVKKPLITQTKDSVKPILPKISIFSISAFVSPEQAGQVIMQNNSVFNVSGETSNLHFNYGLRGAISLNKKWEISLAFSYSQVAINFPPTQLYFSRYSTQPYVFNTSYGDMSVPMATMLQGFSLNAPPSITSFKMNYQYAQTVQFMNVPVCIRLNLGKGKVKPYVTAGLNIQYTLGISSELDLLKENETDVLNYSNLNTRKLNIAPTVSVGIEYDITRHFGVFLEPNARYNVLPASSSSTIKSGTYFMGCMGGLRLNL